MRQGLVSLYPALAFSFCSWAQATPTFDAVLMAFKLDGPFADLEEAGVKPSIWKAGDHKLRKPRAGEWGQAMVIGEKMSLTFEMKDGAVKYLKFGLTGDDLTNTTLPALLKKYPSLKKKKAEEGGVGMEVTYLSDNPPVQLILTKLDADTAKLAKAKYMAEGTIGTAGYLAAIDKAEKEAVAKGDTASPLSIAKGIRLGQSLKELRALGLEARDWVTAGDPRPPKDDEVGISNEFGPQGASYEIQMKGPKLTYVELSFRGDKVQEELIAFLKKAYGELQQKEEEGIIGRDSTYSSKKHSLVCQITELEDEFSKKRRAKFWIRLKIGKDFRADRNR